MVIKMTMNKGTSYRLFLKNFSMGVYFENGYSISHQYPKKTLEMTTLNACLSETNDSFAMKEVKLKRDTKTWDLFLPSLTAKNIYIQKPLHEYIYISKENETGKSSYLEFSLENQYCLHLLLKIPFL